MSQTLTFTGNSSELTSHFSPPLYLKGNWSCGLLTFESYNSIPNVDETNNRIYVIDGSSGFELTNVTSLDTLAWTILNKLPADQTLTIKFVDGFVTIECSKTLYNDFTSTFLTDLGFSPGRVLEANKKHVADRELKTILNRRIIYGDMYELPKGSYELDDIAREFKKLDVRLETNMNTLKCTVFSETRRINFSSKNNIASLLGFEPQTIPPNTAVESQSVVDIFKVNALMIDCSIVKGSWTNGRESHVLHQFFPNVPHGYKIVETPQTVVYLELQTNAITDITIKVLDQDGRPVDFRGEKITVRIHLKRDA